MTNPILRRRLLATSALAAACLASPAPASPEGGTVSAGAAVIAASGGQTTITQSSDKAIIDWRSFDLSGGESASFIQPGARSVLLNRTAQTDASRIDGSITANGRIFIINPNGVIFGQGAQVQAGGLVVSTADIADADFMAGNYRFAQASPRDDAIIVNGGRITVADAGLAAFVAPNVANHGTIVARAGHVTLAGRSTFTLDLAGDGLLAFDTGRPAPAGVRDGAAVALGASDAAALVGGVVDMGGIAAASSVSTGGGRVVLSGGIDVSAQEGNASGGSVSLVGAGISVEAGSRIAADGARHGGSVILIADDGARYAGGITARGGSGDGGLVETSAATVDFTGISVDTSATGGRSGTWLIDPTDLNVDAAAAATIGANLATTNVTLKTFASGNPAGPGTPGNGAGDINVNSAISWTGAHKLTLSAYRNVAVNANIGSASNNASLALIADNSGTGTGTVTFGGGAKLNMSGQDTVEGRPAAIDIYYNPASFGTPTSFAGSIAAGTFTTFMLVNSIEALQSINASDARLRENYALSRDIDASATAGWNDGQGFVPIGSDGRQRAVFTDTLSSTILNGGNGFTGLFDGMGHVVTGLTINRPLADGVGLFSIVKGTIRDLGLVNGSVSGAYFVGGLAAECQCLITGSYNQNLTVSASTVPAQASQGNGGLSRAGGLVGNAFNANIVNSYATGAVSGRERVGGLVGWAIDTKIDRSYATGLVTASADAGGLVGRTAAVANGTIITNSYATGDIRPGAGIFGFESVFDPETLQFEDVQILGVYNFGGLVGSMNYGTISSSYATGSIGLFGSDSQVNRTSYFGGLVGDAYDVTIDDSHASGSVTFWGQGGVGGGLVGYFSSSTTSRGINRSWASGAVTGGNSLGGLVGNAFGLNANPNDNIVDSYATGAVTGTQNVGGLVGVAGVEISGSHATGKVTGERSVGGLVGLNKAAVTTSYATGEVVQRISPEGLITGWAGGLVGWNETTGSIDQAFASGAVSGTQYVGGLVGANYGGVISNAYATGAVTGTVQRIGGLAGFNNASCFSCENPVQGRIGNTYAVGRVTGTGATAVGGLVGENTSDPIVSSYWNTQTSGQAASAGGTGLTTAQMQDLGNFQAQYSGWDFRTIWSPPNRSGQGGDGTAHYPELYGISKVVWADASGAASATRAYGDANPSLGGTVTFHGLRAGDGIVTQPTFAAPATTAVGTYSGLLGGAAASNLGGGTPYRFIYTGGELTITPAHISVTALGGSSTYGQSPADPGLSASGLKNGESVSVLTGLSNSFGITGSTSAGSYTLSVNGILTNPNYVVDTRDTGIWVVDPALLTVVTAGLTGTTGKVYDGTTAATLTPANFVLSGFVGDDAATVNQTAGTYASADAGSGIVVTASLAPSNFIAAGGTDLSNYMLPTMATGAIGTITRAPLTLTYTADAASRDYGAANPAFTGTVSASGLVNGELLGDVTSGTAVFTSTANAASPVGSYAIDGGGLTVNGNYLATFVQAAGNATALTIEQVLINLALSADNRSRAYGDANPMLTYVLTGGALQGGDMFSGELATAATAASPVGDYAITQGTLTAGPNYRIVFTPGILSVLPAHVTVTALGGQSRYGQTPANPGLAASGLKNGESVSVLTGLSNSFGITGATGVGAYALDVVGDLGNRNYIIDARISGSWTVIPAILDLAIQADSLNRAYGEANPLLTYRVSGDGLQPGDQLTGALATAATAASPVGDYAITQGSLSAGANYTILFTPGTLTVTPAHIGVAALGGSSTYGQSPANPGIAATGLKNGESVSVLTGLSSSFGITGATGAGSYTLDVVGTLGNPNYVIDSRTSADWLVNPMALSVRANALARVYGDADPVLSYALTGGSLVNGDQLTGALATAATAASPVGGYAITQGSLSGGANYTILFTPGTLTVTPAHIGVAALGGSSIYGQSPANPGIAATGLKNGEGVSVLTGLSNSFGITASSPAGGYGLAVIGTLTNGNYIVDTRTPGNWTVAATGVPPSGLHGRDRAADGGAEHAADDVPLCGISPETPCPPRGR